MRHGGCTILLLATDLDGTVPGGRQADRPALYRVLRAAEDVRLVPATGHHVDDWSRGLLEALGTTPRGG